MRPGETTDDGVARTAFAIVLGLTAANAVFNVIAFAAGLPFPYTSFLYSASDLFADFFKLALSYPGGEVVRSSGSAGLRDLVAHYPEVVRLAPDGGQVTNLHLMPITTLFAVASVAAMKVVDPLALFLLLSAAMLAWAAWILRSASASRRETWLWIGAAFLSYPMLQTLNRGNLPAGIAALAIVAAMVLAAQRRGAALSAVLLAIAVNIRPNAIVYAAPLLLLHRKEDRVQAFVMLTVAGWGILGASLLLSQHLYPAYTFAEFRAGLTRYHYIYVVGDLGLPYGSSLFGGLKALFGYSPQIEKGAAAVAGLILCAGIVLQLQRRITASTFLFLVGAAYCLGSSAFGDYHLLVFLAPLLCRAIEMRDGTPASRGVADPLPAVLASCLVLAPKNYMFIHIVSYQVVFNPLLLLGTALLIFYQGWRPRLQALPGAKRSATPSMQ